MLLSLALAANDCSLIYFGRTPFVLAVLLNDDPTSDNKGELKPRQGVPEGLGAPADSLS